MLINLYKKENGETIFIESIDATLDDDQEFIDWSIKESGIYFISIRDYYYRSGKYEIIYNLENFIIDGSWIWTKSALDDNSLLEYIDFTIGSDVTREQVIALKDIFHDTISYYDILFFLKENKLIEDINTIIPTNNDCNNATTITLDDNEKPVNNENATTNPIIADIVSSNNLFNDVLIFQIGINIQI